MPVNAGDNVSHVLFVSDHLIYLLVEFDERTKMVGNPVKEFDSGFRFHFIAPKNGIERETGFCGLDPLSKPRFQMRILPKLIVL